MTLLLATCVVIGRAIPPQDRFPCEVDVPSQSGVGRAKIVIDRFEVRGRKVELKRPRPGFAKRVYIDRRMAWGLEGVEAIELPHAMIRSIEIQLAGRTIKVPVHLFADTFEPHCKNEWEKRPSYWLWISEEKKVARLKMWASDGAGSYGVIWTIPFSGPASRQFLYAP